MLYTKEFENRINAAISKNINRYMQQKNITQLELAEHIGVSQATVSNWCKGIKTPRMDKVDKICAYFNISRSDLMEDKKETSWHNNLAIADIEPTIKIPVVGSIPAGTPIEAIECIDDYIDIPQSWTKGGWSFVGLKVKGDSMHPKYLEGDTVIIRLQSDCHSGQDCAVYVNGYEATLKRVIKKKDGLMLQPLNPEYPPKKYEYPKGDEHDYEPVVQILGIVVELRRQI